MPTGSIIAATVCAPMKDASRPDTTDIPKQIFVVRVPVRRTIAKAIRLSNCCFTTATASISEPMMNNTESVIRLFATRVESIPSMITWPTMIRSATVGNGTGSVTNSSVATTDMVSTTMASRLRPSGRGRDSMKAPIAMAMKNQRFSQKK